MSASCTRHPMCPSSAQNSVVCYGVLNSQEKRLILARIPFPADGEHPWKLTDGEFVTKNLKDGTLAKRPVGTHWVPNVMDTKQNLKYLPATTPHRIAPALGIRWQNVSLADERYLPDSADAFRRMGGLVRRRGGEGGAASANKGTYWVFYETSVQVQTFMWAVPVECKMQGLELQLEKLTDDPEGAIRREIEGEVFMAVGVVLEEEKRANREKNRARMATQRAAAKAAQKDELPEETVLVIEEEKRANREKNRARMATQRAAAKAAQKDETVLVIEEEKRANREKNRVRMATERAAAKAAQKDELPEETVSRLEKEEAVRERRRQAHHVKRAALAAAKQAEFEDDVRERKKSFAAKHKRNARADECVMSGQGAGSTDPTDPQQDQIATLALVNELNGHELSWAADHPPPADASEEEWAEWRLEVKEMIEGHDVTEKFRQRLEPDSLVEGEVVIPITLGSKQDEFKPIGRVDRGRPRSLV